MKRLFGIALFAAAVGLPTTGCATNPAPDSPKEQRVLSADVNAAMAHLKASDPTLGEFLDRAYGYAIFPDVGKGAFIVGGSYGRGEVYRQGQLVGYADIKSGSVGLQAGGATFTQLIVFATEQSFNEFTSGQFTMSAKASAVLLKAGGAGSARFENGVVTFVEPRGGAIAGLSLAGQSFSYEPVNQ